MYKIFHLWIQKWSCILPNKGLTKLYFFNYSTICTTGTKGQAKFKVHLYFYNTGLHKEMKVIVPLCYLRKKQDELRESYSLRKEGLLNCLPEGSRVTRLLLGCVLSFDILWALTSQITLMLGKWVPMMFWAVLITCCIPFLPSAVHKPCQFVIKNETKAWYRQQDN